MKVATQNAETQARLTAQLVVLVTVLVGMLALGMSPTHRESAQPKQIRVPQDFPTIQAAIDAASDGDRILVDLGTYRENLTIPKQLTILGASRDGVTIEAATRSQAAIQIVAQGEVSLSELSVTAFATAVLIPGIVAGRPVPSVVRMERIFLKYGGGLVIGGAAQAQLSLVVFADTGASVVAGGSARVELHGARIFTIGCGGQMFLSDSAQVVLADSIVSLVQLCLVPSLGTILVGDRATLRVESSAISNRGSLAGIVVGEQAKAEVLRSFIFQQGDGIVVSGTAEINDTVIQDNGGCGVRAAQTAKIAGADNVIANNRGGDLCPADFPWPPGFKK